MRWIGWALAMAVGVLGSVPAPPGAAQSIPCTEEIRSYCADVQPGGGRLLQCLSAHRAQLTVACTQRVEELQTLLAGPLGVCREDWVAHCYHARTGEPAGAVQCLRHYQQDVSPSCQKALQGSMPANKREAMP